MKAYALDTGQKLWISFGTDAVEAAKSLAAKVGGNWEKFSVCGDWHINPDEPISISQFWPYFTCDPPQRHWQ